MKQEKEMNLETQLLQVGEGPFLAKIRKVL